MTRSSVVLTWVSVTVKYCMVYYCCNLCVDSVEELGRVVIIAASNKGTTVDSARNSPGSGVE